MEHTRRHTLEADNEGLDPTIKSVVDKHICRREEGRHQDQDENMAAQAAFEKFKTLGYTFNRAAHTQDSLEDWMASANKAWWRMI